MGINRSPVRRATPQVRGCSRAGCAYGWTGVLVSGRWRLRALVEPPFPQRDPVGPAARARPPPAAQNSPRAAILRPMTCNDTITRRSP